MHQVQATQPTSLTVERSRRITHAPDLGNWLRQLREDAGLLQRDAALAVEIESRSIRRYENDGDVPNGIVLLRMLSAYGVRLSKPPPEIVPLSINAELAAIRAVLDELRVETLTASPMGHAQMLVRLVAAGVPLTAEGREELLGLAAQEREAGRLLIEQADLLEARLA